MPLQIGNTTVTCLSSNSGNFQQQQQQLSRLVQGSGSSGGVGRMLDEVVDVDELASRQQGQGQTATSGAGGGGGSAGGGGGGSGGGFSGGFTVKQERHDDQEINELAAKILETNKAFIAKTAQQQQLLQQQQQRQQQNSNGGTAANGPNNGNQNIMNYFPRKTNGTQNGTMTNGNNSAGGISGGGSSAGSRMNNGECLSPSGASEQSNGEKKPCDDESVMGHFGWHTFNKSIHIPYILRAQEKYCAVRIAEMKLLNKYLNYLHQDIYNCTCVRSYYITEAESRLLNDINIKHCDGQFGRPLFTHKDLVVRLTDVTKFWTFLDVCYRKLSSGNSGGHSEKCGFIRINKESVVPYTVRDNQKFVPLFYFEGETENLKLKADYLSGWDLSYLKFCCKVQGIRNELFASDQVAVISLTDIKSYFPPGTEFEDYWPSKMVDSQLLVGKNGSHAANNVHWTRQPAAPPSKPTTTVNQPVSNPVTNTAPTRSKQTANPYNNMTAAAPVQQQTASQINQVASNIANMPARLNAAVAHINAQMLSQQQEQYMRLAGSRLRGGESQIQNILQGQYNMLRAIGTNGAQAPPPLVRAANGQTNANAHHMSIGVSGGSVAPLMQSLATNQQQQQQQQASPANNSNNPAFRQALQNQRSVVRSTGNVNLSPSPILTNYNIPQSLSPSLTILPQSSASVAAQSAATLNYLHSSLALTPTSPHTPGSNDLALSPNMMFSRPKSRSTNAVTGQNSHSGFKNVPPPPSLIPVPNFHGSNKEMAKFQDTLMHLQNLKSLTTTVISDSNPNFGQNRQYTGTSNVTSAGTESFSPAQFFEQLQQQQQRQQQQQKQSNLNNNSSGSLRVDTSSLGMSKSASSKPSAVIDLSSPPRSASLQQQQQQQLQQFQMQQYQQQQLLQQQQQQQQQSSQRASRSTAHQQQLHLAQQQMLSQQDALGACLDSGMIPGLSAAYVTRNGMMPAVNPNLINNGPFKLQTTNVDGITVPCINMKPNYSEQWMRLQDLKDNFFPQTTLDNCRRVLEVFSVVVMKANRQQVKVFLESSVRNAYSDNMELVKVTDVKNYMPQLKYIIKSQLQEQPPNKRTRIS